VLSGHARQALFGSLLTAAVLFGFLAWQRDTGYAGPHHDEVIALLASKGLEREYGHLLATGEAPLNHVVPAQEWQRFTKGFVRVSWSEICRDVQAGDKHPPLAFWVFNRWLSLFPHGGYQQAVWLTWLQIVLAAGILAFTVHRLVGSAQPQALSTVRRGRGQVEGGAGSGNGPATGSGPGSTSGLPSVFSFHPSALAFCLFLLGNSAIFTATWVRQYALFAVFYALTMLLASELARERLSRRRSAVFSALLGLACVGGMSTQYTFATMSVPIHLALLGVLAWRREWRRTLSLGAAYVGAAVLFLVLNPGAIQHARAVSQGIARRLQVGEAFGGIPQMVIPWPSFLPAWICWVAGAALLAVILALGGYVAWAMGRRGGATYPQTTRICTDGASVVRTPNPEPCAASGGNVGAAAAVVLSGMLGAGLLQFLLVALGFYHGWATGPNHLCAFWLLTVLAWVLFLHLHPQRWLRALTVVGLVGMLGMLVLYGWHCQRIKPQTNVQYIAREKPDLVYLDNLWRGMVLQITDRMPPGERVLVAPAERLTALLAAGDLGAYRRILYLPMDESVRQSKPCVLERFRQAGWQARELPVVHTGLYEAVWLSR
jgi:hypothetical protein